MHETPTGQATPHAPQFAASLFVVTQRPLQLVSPETQEHEPLLHVRPGPHALPQLPQLFTSV